MDERLDNLQYVFPSTADRSRLLLDVATCPVDRKMINVNLELIRGREERDRGGGERPKKKGRGGGWAIDPLNPTGKTGGKWSYGLVQVIRTVFTY